MIINGTADPLVPYGGGSISLPWGAKRGEIISTDDAVKLWVQRDGTERTAIVEDVPDTNHADGCTIKTFTYAHGQNATEVVLYRLEGGGHTWPGGKQYLPKKLIGTVCRDMDAREDIWKFFEAHPKP
jgi:polyhydroxybutyrate depolymerase